MESDDRVIKMENMGDPGVCVPGDYAFARVDDSQVTLLPPGIPIDNTSTTYHIKNARLIRVSDGRLEGQWGGKWSEADLASPNANYLKNGVRIRF
jgi:hypothetical protein